MSAHDAPPDRPPLAAPESQSGRAQAPSGEPPRADMRAQTPSGEPPRADTPAHAPESDPPGAQDTPAQAGKEQLGYEAASARVEEIIRRLDSGDVGLDETLGLLSEGKTLIELCARELSAVGDALEELRLDELVARLEGNGGG